MKRWHIEAKSMAAGRDKIFMITGGEAHIGAVAVAYEENNNGQIICKVIQMPAHKEEALAREFAQMGAFVLGCTVTVVVGIHIEQATGREIEGMVSDARQAFFETLFG